MENVFSALRDWGCDVTQTMTRMADDEAFYLECLCEVAQDPYFEQLKEALASDRLPQAFDAAHTLKGVLANVGLTPMYEKVVAIVEPLRAGRRDGVDEAFAQLERMREYLLSILGIQ